MRFRRRSCEEKQAERLAKQRLKAERAHRKAGHDEERGAFSKKWFTYPDR